MKNTSHYIGWSHSGGVSYGEYLQDNEFEKSIRYGIEDQTKEIIASNEQLSREHIQVLGQVNDSIDSGFSNLSMNVDALRGDLQDLSSVFAWGFSEVLVSLGRVNDSLDALIKLAKSPAQTWAYEQFEIARDEFRRGLYHESLESVLKAINGYGSNPGYKTEFRFHFLQGTILLGSFKNSDPKLIDPFGAEEAFLRAARYATNDMSLEAAQCFLCAGRAAFVQKKTENALKYSANAIAINPKLDEAHFQSAQVLCVLGRPEEGLEHLVTAIADEHEYSIKAADDADISQHSEMLKKALILARDRYRKTYELDRKKFKAAINEIRDIEMDGYAVKSLCSEQLAFASKYENEFEAEASADKIFGYVQASRLARKIHEVVLKIAEAYEVVSIGLINDKKAKLEHKIPDANVSMRAIYDDIQSVNKKRHDSEPWTLEIVDVFLGIIIALGLFYLLGKLTYFMLAVIFSFGFAFLPFVWLMYFARKLLWKLGANDVDSKKSELQNMVDEKTEELKEINKKLVELQAIKSRIENLKKSIGVEANAALARIANKGNFAVVLKSCGRSKINVIKLVREIAGFELEESKDLVDNAPRIVAKVASEKEAMDIVEEFKNIGAEAELRRVGSNGLTTS